MDAVAEPCSGRLENYQQEKIFMYTLASRGNFPRQPQFVGFCYNLPKCNILSHQEAWPKWPNIAKKLWIFATGMPESTEARYKSEAK